MLEDAAARPAGGSRTTLTTALAEGSEFKVLGYCVPYAAEVGGVSANPDWAAAAMPWNDKAKLSHADVFYNQTVGVTATGATYSPLQPWKTKDATPAEVSASWQYLYSFMAYYPAGAFTVSPASSSAAGAPRLTFHMPFSGDVVTGTVDHSAVTDALITARFDHRRSDGKVGLIFDHILTGLQFRVRNYSNSGLTIERVKLSGKFYRTATFDFSTATVCETVTPLAADFYKGEFILFSGSMTVDPTEQKYVGGDGTDYGTRLLLLYDPEASPETSDNGSRYSIGSDKVLSVRYRFEGEAESHTWNLENFKLSYSPRRNTCYTAQLNFVGKDFVLIFEAENNWENGSDNEIIIQ